MAVLPYVKVVRSEIAGVQLGIVFSFRAASDLLPRALEAAQRIFVRPSFGQVYASDMEVWVDSGDVVDLDSLTVDALIAKMTQEVGFSPTEPVPLELVQEYLEEAMRPHLPR
jgi:hypothetical protein